MEDNIQELMVAMTMYYTPAFGLRSWKDENNNYNIVFSRENQTFWVEIAYRDGGLVFSEMERTNIPNTEYHTIRRYLNMFLAI